ncbi:MAG: flagellar filament capping protein FliD [Betaproteobacteria bacterium]|nr:flagellar filament capping protein FliD [Betaproteobacteria bacterium]MDE2211877.1 flagellar filament capping protein FliD [Betaproteobacteria bacterium]
MAVTASSSVVSAAPVTTQSIDVSSIVSQLMTVQSQPVTLLQQQEASYQTQLTALGTVNGALTSFQSAVQGLTSASQYQALNATSSNSAVGVTAAAGAAQGNYSVSVSSLAQAQSLIAAGQTSQTAAIGSGATTTLTFNFGTISGGSLSNGIYSGASFQQSSSPSQTVTINSSNNSLQGIAAAINAANIGVSATIVNDGSASPYRLVLTGPSGLSNSMQISVSGDATLSGLLSENPATTTQDLTQSTAAQNAQFTVNGISMTQSSNTVANAIQGLTFTLSGVTTSPASISVASNTTGIAAAVNSFVNAYNALNKAVLGVSSYNSSTNTAGTLMGDPMVNAIETQMHAALNNAITNTTSTYSSLDSIGVTFQKDGSLAIDTTKLNTAISTNASDIASLFATVGKATDSLVSYSAAGPSTQPGSYAVNVTQLGRQGSLTGSGTAGLTITQGSNDTLNLTVDGVATTIVIPPGTYTAASLSTQLQSLINSTSGLVAAGQSVSVTQNSGTLTITANNYGSASTVAVTGGNASSTLLGANPAQTNGQDVAGTINGATATGNGQYLTSTTGNSNGLVVQVAGGPTGSRGTVNYSQGYAVTLNNIANSMLDPLIGPLAAETNGINTNISDINNQITQWQARLANIQQALTQQYSALNTMLGTMSQTSSYLTQQLSQLLR